MGCNALSRCYATGRPPTRSTSSCISKTMTSSNSSWGPSTLSSSTKRSSNMRFQRWKRSKKTDHSPKNTSPSSNGPRTLPLMLSTIWIRIEFYRMDRIARTWLPKCKMRSELMTNSSAILKTTTLRNSTTLATLTSTSSSSASTTSSRRRSRAPASPKSHTIPRTRHRSRDIASIKRWWTRLSGNFRLPWPTNWR